MGRWESVISAVNACYAHRRRQGVTRESSHLLDASSADAHARAAFQRIFSVHVANRALHVAVRLEPLAVDVLAAVDVRGLASLALARPVAVSHGALLLCVATAASVSENENENHRRCE